MAKEKQAPHLTFNVAAPDGSCKQISWGPVCDMKEFTTSYALKIVMEHARKMTALYKFNGWHM